MHRYCLKRVLDQETSQSLSAETSVYVVRGCFAVLCSCLLLQDVCATEGNAFDKLIAPAIQSYCADCHGSDGEAEGDLDLLTVTHDDLRHDTELMQRLIEVLDLEEMPPEDSEQPTAEVRAELVAELKAMQQQALSENGVFRHTPIRRMNRFQYNNAVTDLFQLNCIVLTLPERMMRGHKDYFQPESGKMAAVVSVGSRPLGKGQLIEPRLAEVASFPQDLRAEHGFDNRGDHLTMSPLLMESFLQLAKSITNSRDFVAANVGIWQSFFAAPSKTGDLDQQIRARLRPFLQTAFRSPVDESVLNRFTRFAVGQIDSGVSFTDAMKAVAAATISSPRFLYLYDKALVSDTDRTVDDLELASRLSFFLWGSIPDRTLMQLAMSGTLTAPEVLEGQVDRMLKDRKLKRFCDSFPSQWLQLERIVSSRPDRDHFPGFYYLQFRDSMHMMLEPLLLFETVLIENQSVTQLIDSDFTYRSRVLDEAYGELRSGSAKTKGKGRAGVGELKFYRVPVKDRRNGGVITNAAVMTMTSGAENSQPITRGAWVAGVIFNNPPDPPPADVPELNEKPPEGEENLTLRERLSMHRKRSDCKGCHEQIDPLGFALENYNAIGNWRDRYENGREVDMASELFRKHKFSDVVEFKDAILAEKDRFTRGLAGHLLSFALARQLDAADQAALDEMTEATADDGYRMQTLLKQVIFSRPFLSKTTHPLKTTHTNK